MKSLFLSAALALAASTAQACEEFVALDRVQTTDLVATVKDQEQDALTQLFAFETLMCSNKPGVRDLTLRIGATSPNPTIQGQVLTRAIMEQESIQVELLNAEGLSKVHYNRIKERPIESFPVNFRDYSRACLSFYASDSCAEHSVLSISGTKVLIRVRYSNQAIDGDFRIDGGVLKGTMTFVNDDLTYPAQIELF